MIHMTLLWTQHRVRWYLCKGIWHSGWSTALHGHGLGIEHGLSPGQTLY
jgi:hypothetical protein